MRKVFFGLVFYSSFCFVTCSSIDEDTKPDKVEFRIASYNIRYLAPQDNETGNSWVVRKEPVTQLILQHGFDIVGTQEGHESQLRDLKRLLPDYNYLGAPYGGADGHLHNCATFYRKEKFEPLDSGCFWLSETPDLYSLGWDATDSRICFWVKFKEKVSGRKFYVFNAHFYWRYVTARQKSGPLMVKKMKEIADQTPIVCLGDFNSKPETSQIRCIKDMLADSYEKVETLPQGPQNTSFPGGVFTGEPGERIDYVFVSKHFSVLNYSVLTDSYGDGRYPSDHLPVVCDLIMNE